MTEKSKEIRPERFGDYYKGDEWKELFVDKDESKSSNSGDSSKPKKSKK